MERVHFASGSNRPSDIRGFAAINHAIGVTAQELSANAIDELCKLAGRGIPVFVDSGAFSEIKFGPTGPVVVKPITPEGWEMRFALWNRLGMALGADLHIVAPDRIGDQAHTLALLTRYAHRLATLASMGVQILVPMQRGEMCQAAFHAKVSEILRFGWTPAIPAKKNATSVEEVRDFCATVKPRRLHLLGMGPNNAKLSAMLGAVNDDCVVSLDSNKIAANVGRNPRPRKLTAARDKARELIAAGFHTHRSIGELGIMLAFGGTL